MSDWAGDQGTEGRRVGPWQRDLSKTTRAAEITTSMLCDLFAAGDGPSDRAGAAK